MLLAMPLPTLATAPALGGGRTQLYSCDRCPHLYDYHVAGSPFASCSPFTVGYQHGCVARPTPGLAKSLTVVDADVVNNA